jgi:hypothetical protein
MNFLKSAQKSLKIAKIDHFYKFCANFKAIYFLLYIIFLILYLKKAISLIIYIIKVIKMFNKLNK